MQTIFAPLWTGFACGFSEPLQPHCHSVGLMGKFGDLLALLGALSENVLIFFFTFSKTCLKYHVVACNHVLSFAGSQKTCLEKTFPTKLGAVVYVLSSLFKLYSWHQRP